MHRSYSDGLSLNLDEAPYGAEATAAGAKSGAARACQQGRAAFGAMILD